MSEEREEKLRAMIASHLGAIFETLSLREWKLTFPRLADLVWAVTGCGKNRKERVADAMAKIRECPAAIPLKLADRIANVRAAGQKRSDLFAMYAREYTAFVLALRPASNPDDGRETAMWLELDRIFRGAEDSR